MNKNELTGVIGIAVITAILAFCVPVVMSTAPALGIILLIITVILGIGVIVSVVSAIREHLAAKEIDKELNTLKDEDEDLTKSESTP